MKIRQTLFYWLLVTLLSVGAAGAILTSYLPQNNPRFTTTIADGQIMAGLYASIFLIILGICVFVGYGIRQLIRKQIYPSDNWPVVRHGSLIALGLTTMFILQGFRVLMVWDVVLLVIALILVELSFHIKPTI